MVEAEKVLQLVASLKGHEFTLQPHLIGGAAYDAFSDHCPLATLEARPRQSHAFSTVNGRPESQACALADAILFGSVGGPVDEQHLPKWKNCEKNALLGLRKTCAD